MIKLLMALLISSSAQATLMDEKPFGLIGGSPVQPDEYEEVIRITNGKASCSASLIGPRVVLTAAHCTGPNGDIFPVSAEKVYEFTKGRTVYKARCQIAPDYRSRTGDQDMALCKTDKAVSGKYAIVMQKGPKINELVTLVGYGCTSESGRGGNDGILRVGDAPVTKLDTKHYYSFHTKGDSALCFGDSGGPAFKRSIKGAYHYIYGVNSRGDIRELSMLTSVYHPNSIKFMKDFERSFDVQICGISLTCDGSNEEPKAPKCQDEMQSLKHIVARLDMCLENSKL